MSVIEVDCVESIKNTLEKNLNPYGFEFQPFKVAWYNSLVQPIFRINCNEDTVAFLVISNPRMFESAFIPFIRSQAGVLNNLNDPIDQCMVYYLSKVSEIFPDHNVKIIHDFELHPNRRPKVVMQSIAHASGVAYFYHPKSVPDHNWSNEKMFGVCVHPKYGGWFALRAVIFFENLYCLNLPQSLPKDVIPSKEDRLKLLELYNFHWKDWRFRDIFPVAEKYSEMQINYFSTPPNKRHDVIKDLLNTLSYTNGH